MQYTASPDHVIHPATGQRMGTDDSATPTVWSADDANMLIWSLMEIVKDAGLAGAAFNASVPASYRVLVTAIKSISSVPSGALTPWAGAVPPAGWLECNGAAVDRSTYAALFVVCGTTYGAGNGSSTFNLPDLRGEFVRGWDHGRGIDAGRAIGSAQDWATGRPRTADPSRLNADGSTGVLNGSSAEALPGGGNPSEVGFVRVTNIGQAATASATDATYSGTELDIFNVVIGDAETRPRNVALMYIIKT